MNPSAASWSHLSLVLRVFSSTIPKIWWNSEPSAVESPDVVVPDHTRPAVRLSHRVDLEAGLKINDLDGSFLSSYSVFIPNLKSTTWMDQFCLATLFSFPV